MEANYGDKGRRVACPCCKRRYTVRPHDLFEARFTGGQLRIVSADRDGAIVEQVAREDERWGISYFDLQRDYYPVRGGHRAE
jgi:hypothetical protein